MTDVNFSAVGGSRRMAMAVQAALPALRDGGVIAYPTESVFGLGCDPQDEAAVRQLLALKRRAPGKGLILIAADWQQLRPYLAELRPDLKERVLASWPGPVTWLLPAAPNVARWLRGRHATLAVRVTAHAPAALLCRRFGGALVSTSANRSGRPPCRDAVAVRRVFGSSLDAIVPAAVGSEARPTRIIDGRSGAVLRY